MQIFFSRPKPGQPIEAIKRLSFIEGKENEVFRSDCEKLKEFGKSRWNGSLRLRVWSCSLLCHGLASCPYRIPPGFTGANGEMAEWLKAAVC